MAISCDIAVIGGGIMGSAIAYFLGVNQGFDGSVYVVERDPTYDICATSRSWGGVRHQFTLKENVEISLFMSEFLADLTSKLSVDGETVDVGFKQQGYLFLAGSSGASSLRAAVESQHAWGAATEIYDHQELAARFPWLNIGDLTAGAFGAQEGWLDPYSLLMAYRKKARHLGAVFRHDDVVSMKRDGSTLTRIELASGEELWPGIIVNAAGPWAGKVASMADCYLPVEPRKRMTYVFDCREDLSEMPLTIDPSGLAFRPESGQFLAIHSPPEEEDEEGKDLDLDLAPFETDIWPALAHRVPAFEAIKLSRAWAGFYDYNTFDHNAVIGPHPELANFYFCNGFSGHGIQQSAAAGRAIAELICHGDFETLDLSRFDYRRIPENKPVREVNIV